MDLTAIIVRMGPLELLLAAFLTLLAVGWFLVPFALFGLRRRVERLQADLALLMAEQRRTSELLGGAATRPPAAGPLKPAPRIEPPPERTARRPLVARRD